MLLGGLFRIAALLRTGQTPSAPAAPLAPHICRGGPFPHPDPPPLMGRDSSGQAPPPCLCTPLFCGSPGADLPARVTGNRIETEGGQPSPCPLAGRGVSWGSRRRLLPVERSSSPRVSSASPQAPERAVPGHPGPDAGDQVLPAGSSALSHAGAAAQLAPRSLPTRGLGRCSPVREPLGRKTGFEGQKAGPLLLQLLKDCLGERAASVRHWAQGRGRKDGRTHRQAKGRA